jgi:hypothetical protein
MKPHGMAGIALGLAFLAFGCAPPSTPPAAPPPAPVSSDPRDKIPHGMAPAVDRTLAEVDLKEIATYYQIHEVDGPTARDGVLKDIQRDDQPLYKRIQAGLYVLLRGDPAQAGNAVLAYEKDAPTQGGIVVVGYVPQRMTLQEFQAAFKAGQP